MEKKSSDKDVSRLSSFNFEIVPRTLKKLFLLSKYWFYIPTETNLVEKKSIF